MVEVSRGYLAFLVFLMFCLGGVQGFNIGVRYATDLFNRKK